MAAGNRPHPPWYPHAVSCLDDNTAVEFASGDMAGAATARVEAHLASCRDCRTLVAALAPAPGDPDSDLATPVRPALGKRGARDLHLADALASTDARRGSEPRRPLDPVVAVGDTIGRYVVLRRIGAGGMGVVFAAYDPQLDRRVALKLLRTGVGLGEGEAKARLVREAQAIAQLSHPHVVAVYDVGTATTGDVYIAMEFVEGDTLTNWLQRWERSWRDVVEMFVDAGRGLAAAHGVGLLHRDFKPDNVLVGADGRVRVTDFGLARSLVTGGEDGDTRPTRELAQLRVTLTATGAVMGTPRYMAPEQLAGKDISAAADQWSFCVALYEAVYGVHPIAGDTAAKMLDEGARMRPPPEGKGVPASLLAVVTRGLDAVPARRYPSMTALLAELTHALRPPRRRYLAIGGAAALVLGGAAAATIISGRTAAAPPSIDPVVIVEMQRQIDELQREKQVLVERIKESAEQGAEVEVLAERLVQANGRIKELEQKLEQVAVLVPPPKPVRPKPTTTPGFAVSIVATAVRVVEGDLHACFVEWSERTQGNTAEVALHVRTFPDGRPRSVVPSGENDRALRDCVEFAGNRLQLPRIDAITVFDVATRFHDQVLDVEIGNIRTEAPPQLIENAGQ